MTSQRRPDPARGVALEVLLAVAQRDAYANLVLPTAVAQANLDARDAAFATELTYGALRMRGFLDSVLEQCVDRSLTDLDPEVLAVLQLGAQQLLHMRVPSHAAVSTSVDLVRAVGGRGPSGLVNAVLRRVAVVDQRGWVQRLAPAEETDPLGYLAVAHAHPRWIVEAFHDALGGDLTETRAVLAADNAAPQVSLVARPGRAQVSDLLAAGATAGRWSPYAATVSGDVRSVPGIESGAVGVQDEGSQLVTIAATHFDIGADHRWLDLCAGPGGKAALWSGIGQARGAQLLCAERREHRAGLVAKVLGGGAVVVADGRSGAWAPAVFDRVLADVPCTGLGALRRRPEARWRRHPDDVAALGPLQRGLLSAALRSTRPGGLVAYVTCSPHLAETVEVVTAVLRTLGDVQVLDARPAFADIPHLGEGPFVQLWPHRHGTDAMFCALLRPGAGGAAR